MEDVHKIGLDAMSVIEERLLTFGIVLTPAQEDAIYVHMVEQLEELSNGDYRSQL